MIRLLALVTVGLVLGSAIMLYRFKEEAAGISAQIDTLRTQIAREHETINVLRAEWNYLNQPSRVQSLAQRYLEMEQLAVEQVGHVSELPMRPLDIDPYEGGRLGGFAGGSERVIQ
ncbi:cell division protein FtsL [Lutibaculum baratangense]|uniref:Cell division protein FtsL n=1 Tax=Lutibaculum baratangense AMV1 TaxID=631454 RepID=V4TNS0_9HYPH|nr:hypothetical protein [Lutibaculum baratangense]ESR27338.1 hypothetical protein N177_0317 [Lutibaculum baratangense AMV1]